MPTLNSDARYRLQEAGISQAEWIRRWSWGPQWYGDACGCPDDHCINYHHNAGEDCRCLEALITDPEIRTRRVRGTPAADS